MHLILYLLNDFLYKRGLRLPITIGNLDLSLKMIWFHWSTNQFWWSLAHIEHFRFCLNVSRGFEIDILLSYPRWWRVRDQETATQALFNTLEISPQQVNRLEIRILYKWRSSLSVVLGLELQLDHFKQVRLVIFEMADKDYPTWTVISFWVLPASHNAWMMAFCAFDISLTLINYDTGRWYVYHGRFHFLLPMLWHWKYVWNYLIS